MTAPIDLTAERARRVGSAAGHAVAFIVSADGSVELFLSDDTRVIVGHPDAVVHEEDKREHETLLRQFRTQLSALTPGVLTPGRLYVRIDEGVRVAGDGCELG